MMGRAFDDDVTRRTTTEDGDGDGDGFTARRERRWRAKRGVVGDATVDANLVDEKDEDDDEDDDDEENVGVGVGVDVGGARIVRRDVEPGRGGESTRRGVPGGARNRGRPGGAVAGGVHADVGNGGERTRGRIRRADDVIRGRGSHFDVLSRCAVRGKVSI